MNVVIIEDQKQVANHLAEMLQKIDSSIKILSQLHSVKESIEYFKKNNMPNLIFSDTELGDGYSFEICKEIKNLPPVIYCSAHHQHAMEAFNNNGIAYILKPYSLENISKALHKYHAIGEAYNRTNEFDYNKFISNINVTETQQPKTLLVNTTNKIIPIKIDNIAYINIETNSTQITTAEQTKFKTNLSLDELEKYCGDLFFRASRQVLVNKLYIKDVAHYGQRKLFVNLTIDTTTNIIINKTKSTEFLNWLKH